MDTYRFYLAGTDRLKDCVEVELPDDAMACAEAQKTAAQMLMEASTDFHAGNPISVSVVKNGCELFAVNIAPTRNPRPRVNARPLPERIMDQRAMDPCPAI